MNMQGHYSSYLKTKTKVVHKNVSQGFKMLSFRLLRKILIDQILNQKDIQDQTSNKRWIFKHKCDLL